MRIITYNVNGIRSALRKNFLAWLRLELPDVLCVQELKALPVQCEPSLFEDLGYHSYWFSAERKGYSGVGLLSLEKPSNVTYGIGHSTYDSEGRVLRADFGDISIISLYMPSGSSGQERQNFKMRMLADFYHYAQTLLQTRSKLIISGDYNICHTAQDIHDPIGNKNSSGFLPEERQWLSQFLKLGFIDTFRSLNPTKQEYTWWSYRQQARKKNLGWRIDYHMISQTLKPNLRAAQILGDVVHSDHCPAIIELK